MRSMVLALALVLTAAAAEGQERVFFVGNSMTFYNDMPRLFEGIASDKGHAVEVRSYTVGGTGLAEMVASGEVIRQLEEGRWDKVVLQPGTGESAGTSLTTGAVARAVGQLIAAARTVNADAKVYLYEISNGIIPGDGHGDYNYYLLTQQRILDTVRRIAHLAGVPFAPAGECFREHYSAHQDLMLHSSFNDIHPNLAGSYLVACAIFETLYEEPVAPCRFHSTLDAAQAEYLQGVAGRVVLPRREEWLMGAGGDDDDPTDVGIRCVARRRLEVYPNPSSGLVHIDTCGEVVVYDLMGSATRTEARGGQLDLTGFAPGSYILQAGDRRQRLILTAH